MVRSSIYFIIIFLRQLVQFSCIDRHSSVIKIRYIMWKWDKDKPQRKRPRCVETYIRNGCSKRSDAKAQHTIKSMAWDLSHPTGLLFQTIYYHHIKKDMQAFRYDGRPLDAFSSYSNTSRCVRNAVYTLHIVRVIFMFHLCLLGKKK